MKKTNFISPTRVSSGGWLLIAIIVGSSPCPADSPWTGWLGPGRDGWVVNFVPPQTWPDELTSIWQVDVGEGYGTPLVDKRRVFQHSRQGDEEVVRCLDLRSGKEIWRQSWPVPFKIGGGGEWHGAGPKSNPVMSQDLLVTLSIDGVVTAWSAETGEKRWRRDERARFPVNHPYWGASTSPIIDGDHLYVHLGNDDAGVLMALDVGSGETIWEQGKDGTSYSSPLVVDLEGVRQVVEWNHDSVVGVDANQGKMLWTYPFPHVESNQNMPTPVVHNDHVIVGGENRGIRSLRPIRSGDQWTVQETWFQEELALNMS
ncbi:MAG: PQQ-binding-like beta-propeller repeat protein, partial [Planctomycetota bacterium]